MRKILLAALAAVAPAAAAAAPVSTPQVAERIAIPDGGWDLLAVDPAAPDGDRLLGYQVVQGAVEHTAVAAFLTRLKAECEA